MFASKWVASQCRAREVFESVPQHTSRRRSLVVRKLTDAEAVLELVRNAPLKAILRLSEGAERERLWPAGERPASAARKGEGPLRCAPFLIGRNSKTPFGRLHVFKLRPFYPASTLLNMQIHGRALQTAEVHIRRVLQ